MCKYDSRTVEKSIAVNSEMGNFGPEVIDSGKSTRLSAIKRIEA